MQANENEIIGASERLANVLNAQVDRLKKEVLLFGESQKNTSDLFRLWITVESITDSTEESVIYEESWEELCTNPFLEEVLSSMDANHILDNVQVSPLWRKEELANMEMEDKEKAMSYLMSKHAIIVVI